MTIEGAIGLAKWEVEAMGLTVGTVGLIMEAIGLVVGSAGWDV